MELPEKERDVLAKITLTYHGVDSFYYDVLKHTDNQWVFAIEGNWMDEDDIVSWVYCDDLFSVESANSKADSTNKTKDILLSKNSYKGCNPEIAEHLKRGEHVICKVWDTEERFKKKAIVIGFYRVDDVGRYAVIDDLNMCDYFCNAEPVRTQKKVKSAINLMKLFVNNGYVHKSYSDTGWKNKNSFFHDYYWGCCGMSKSETEDILGNLCAEDIFSHNEWLTYDE